MRLDLLIKYGSVGTTRNGQHRAEGRKAEELERRRARIKLEVQGEGVNPHNLDAGDLDHDMAAHIGAEDCVGVMKPPLS